MADQSVHKTSSAANSERSGVLRHDLEVVRALSDAAIQVRAPRRDEVPDLLAMAAAAIGAPLAQPDVVARILDHDPESFWVFQREGRILGGVAFLHLSPRGMQQLIAGSIDLRAPDPQLLCARGERRVGIYVWALFGRGRAGVGISRTIEHLRGERFRGIDLWAVPHTNDGQRFLRCLGFRPAFAETADLYRYPRGEHRAS